MPLNEEYFFCYLGLDIRYFCRPWAIKYFLFGPIKTEFFYESALFLDIILLGFWLKESLVASCKLGPKATASGLRPSQPCFSTGDTKTMYQNLDTI